MKKHFCIKNTTKCIPCVLKMIWMRFFAKFDRIFFFEIHSNKYINIQISRQLIGQCNEPNSKMIWRKWFKQIKFARLLFSLVFFLSSFAFGFNFNHFIYFNLIWIPLSNDIDSTLHTRCNEAFNASNIFVCLCVLYNVICINLSVECDMEMIRQCIFWCVKIYYGLP